jgi:hypothetical protein
MTVWYSPELKTMLLSKTISARGYFETGQHQPSRSKPRTLPAAAGYTIVNDRDSVTLNPQRH